MLIKYNLIDRNGISETVINKCGKGLIMKVDNDNQNIFHNSRQSHKLQQSPLGSHFLQ